MSTQLPPELWIQIFSFACSVPGELNSNATSLFERPSHTNAYNARAKLVQTRRALPLVCRMFYDIGTPLLYRSISLRRKQSLDPLVTTLRECNETEKVDQAMTKCRGRGTRRVDIDFKRPKYWYNFKAASIHSLLVHMPNLEIFVAFGQLGLSSDFSLLGAGLLACKNLKVISVPSSILLLHENESFPSATTLPSCATLRECIPSDSFHMYKRYPGQHELTYRYPEMRAIMAPDPCMGRFTTNDPRDFPRLSTLYVNNIVDENFITIHGFKIATADLLDTRWSRFTPFLEHFPNLHRVILDVQRFYEATRWDVTLKRLRSPVCTTVRDVGMTRRRAFSLKGRYETFFKALLLVFPNAVRICILDSFLLGVISEQLQGRNPPWFRTLTGRQVRLEREDGSLFK